MIDVSFLRQNVEKIGALIKKKDPSFDVAGLLKLDATVREVTVRVEALRSQKNDLAQKAKGGVTSEVRDASIALGKELKEQEAVLESSQKELHELSRPQKV